MSDTFDGYRLLNPAPKLTPLVYTNTGAIGGISTVQFNLTLLVALNSSANDNYFQLFEKSPVAGDVPVMSFAVASLSQLSWAPSQNGRSFAKLYWAVSSTALTYTAAADDYFVSAEGQTSL